MIEVGEYVRFKNGLISKVTECRYAEDYKKLFKPDNRLMSYQKDKYWFDNLCGCRTDTNIVKHSKNIIDLIEVGDIVHTKDVLEEDYYWMFNEEMIKATRETIESGIKLVDILTHEQYENNCYRLED